ncbi:GNAT family N-acetyltransferase [Blastococcus sp. CT_GayMR19]|uniref:GNAT family N-acetyltransferase n=1 Tax=Blastococcus sp. CT_GayMR19 TaxID=2559608 RepID=UPI0010749548|nr:GNAT family N-acetyltransferase [Blastococcus sp. CT_GayMR19]TFV77645.1 GNAT family N-acetyltransferase [Blastococcus sp. CT_GayMR19]
METGSPRDEVLLRDGTPLEVRPIRPADGDALVALHARLSADSIYRRYFGARPHLAPADVERFTRVDGRARFALVAMRGTDLVAVARYEGRPGERSAELAVVIDDALQHQGLGRLMLERLVDVGREAGLHTIVADVLTGNAAMLGLLRTLQLPQRRESDGETVTVSIDLTAADPPAARLERARAHLARAGSENPPG